MAKTTKKSVRSGPSSMLRDQVLHQRYLRKDEHGRVVETPRKMFWRIAQAVAAAEAKDIAKRPEIRQLARQVYRLMAGGLFLPNTPTVMSAGRGNGMCLSACFVLPVPDSIDGIFEAVKQTAQVQKAGGGTGFAFDKLRPTGDLVASSGGTTSGPITFMRVYVEATKAIQQGAFRRGANMAMMAIYHPDILKFVLAKYESGEFENFNFSVKITSEFMRVLFDCPNEPHVVVNPRTGERHLIPKDVDIAIRLVLCGFSCNPKIRKSCWSAPLTDAIPWLFSRAYLKLIGRASPAWLPWALTFCLYVSLLQLVRILA
jgi:ribonucleoside-diphosphate reductase alpha chain